MLLFRQIAILVWKNILIALVRHPITTPLRALVLPIVFTWFLSYAKNFFVPYATYGIAPSSRPVRSLQNALQYVGGGRETVALVRSNFTGGLIDRVISNITSIATSQGKDVSIIDDPVDLLNVCKSSLNGGSKCIAAVQFYASPDEGPGGIWNYTLLTDGSLGEHIEVNEDDNDVEIYAIPLQHAVDWTIASLNTTIDQAALPNVREYPYTDETQDERATSIRKAYMRAIIDFLGVGFFIGICGISYQQVGAQAVEREIRMSALMEVMMPNKRRWEPQVARLASYWLSFFILYIPGWIVMAVILKTGVFVQTNTGIIIVFHLLTGMALASSALFVAAFFRRAQLSGITAILINLILAIVAQVFDYSPNSTVAPLSFFFPSMNYVYFIIFMARWERRNVGANLAESAPHALFTLPGIVFWVFLIIQIILYPLAAIAVERILWGTTSSRSMRLPSSEDRAIRVNGFTKLFRPSFFRRKVLPIFGKKAGEEVVAVKDLDFEVRSGEILVLLGANGSGKSTTLDAISGLSKPSSGTIAVDFAHGLGFCPQTNVLWKELSVEEHVQIFGRLKALDNLDTKADRLQLIRDCDLAQKVKAHAGSLSGGQMRKLQLALLFVGGSRVCLIDEISSGLDPLARRKIQDIIFAERARLQRSIIFTTHFLDEAETVADQILVLSKGQLKMAGTVPEIKTQSAGGYRVHLQRTPDSPPLPRFDGIKQIDKGDEVILEISDPSQAAEVLSQLENDSAWSDYSIQGPSLQDAFMAVAEEMRQEAITFSSEASKDLSLSDKAASGTESPVPEEEEKALSLQTGHAITPLRQFYILLQKRFVVFRRNPLPNLVAMLIPFIAAGLVTLFLKGFSRAGCTPTDQVSISDVNSFSSVAQDYTIEILAGPSSRLNSNDIGLLEASLGIGRTNASSQSGLNVTAFSQTLKFVNTIDEFNTYIAQNYHNVTPGGLFFDGDTATFAYVADTGLASAVLMQNLVDVLATNISISTQYSTFSIPWQANQGNTLQFAIYFGLVVSIMPAFFSLYPTLERIRQVRGFQYSNGVRPIALWPSYLLFDMVFVTIGVTISIILFAGINASVFFDLGLFWLVLFFYGMAGTLLSYCVSLFAKSQLAAFAFSAAYAAICFLLYLIAYLSTLTYAPVDQIEAEESYVYFTLAIIFPAASLLRSIFISLNLFNINCRGVSQYASSGSEMLAYGGPITYLLLQAVIFFAFLVWWESGLRFGSILAFFQRKRAKAGDGESQNSLEPEIAAEATRAQAATEDGLTAIHLSKAYGKNLAVDDITFGIHKDEVFALLGPNGAGKSTTISMIRGDLRPTQGQISIDSVSLLKHRTAALQRLGVCPQFDALDQLSVSETLRFYARVRGVPDVEPNVIEVIRAVGLAKFKDRMAMALSGGNKRKLSLAIALMGNPALVLLDEPSSGMDVAAKRIMWKTLQAVSSGRSILLVTHSMEEADALANRAGIIAKRFLAFGSSDYLRRKHGDRYHVHMVLRSAPHTSPDEIESVKRWILRTFDGAEVEARMGHGQIRFSVPASKATVPTVGAITPPKFDLAGKKDVEQAPAEITITEAEPARSAADGSGSGNPRVQGASRRGMAAVFAKLEASKAEIGFDFYTVAQTTLDQVFLNVVEKHNIAEENYHEGMEEPKVRRRKWFKRG